VYWREWVCESRWCVSKQGLRIGVRLWRAYMGSEKGQCEKWVQEEGGRIDIEIERIRKVKKCQYVL
jgi:hypothetical protein